MVPLRLMVRNFLSYGDTAETLSFDGLHLFCLSGDNGNGKSALLDAMTWALWGQSRATTQDELVHAGATEMSVVLDFQLNGATYQVLRTRKLRKNIAMTTLEFRVERDGEFVPLTGSSVDDTEATIVKTLGMGYRTFVNSAFLLQGRADEFTKKTAAERKQILAEVLNLQRYELLEQHAREKKRDFDARVKVFEGQVNELDVALAQEPVLRQNAADAAQRLTVASAQYELALARQRELEAQRELLRSKEQRRQELAAEADGVRQQYRSVDDQIQVHRAEEARAQVLLQQAPELQAGYERWSVAQAAKAEQDDRLRQLQPYQEDVRTASSALAHERTRLEGKLSDARRRRKEQAARVATGQQAKEKRVALRAELESSAQREQQRDAAQAAILEVEKKQAELKAANTQAERRLEELRGHYKLLAEASAVCPVCSSNLDNAWKAALHDRMKQEAGQMKTQIQVNVDTLARLANEQRGYQETMAHCIRALKNLSGLQRQDGVLAEQERAGDEAQTLCATLDAEIARLQATLIENAFLPDVREALTQATAAIAAIGYDPVAHRALAAQVEELKNFPTALARLEEARHRQNQAAAALVHLAGQRAQLVERASRMQEQLDGLQTELAALPGVEHDLVAQQQQVRRAAVEHMEAHQRRGATLEALAVIEQRKDVRATLAATLAQTRDDAGVYADLVTAFGKNGVQAMLIEEAIPQIQDEANRLLERMTDGQMTVSLETQKQTKKGETAETLEIKIGDQLNTRRYEMFSGGEAFRVNFALRIALSRLLAHRSGARLQTLVIDEGFGSQDGKGRERLVEAINSIQSDFEKIMVITHVDDLKDAFPQRVDIVKDERGSHILTSVN